MHCTALYFLVKTKQNKTKQLTLELLVREIEVFVLDVVRLGMGQRVSQDREGSHVLRLWSGGQSHVRFFQCRALAHEHSVLVLIVAAVVSAERI